MAELRVCALGGVRVFIDQNPLPFPSRRAQELLCFLVLHAGERLERDLIAERLWPMRPPGRARRCLSTALWRLRQTLADAPLPPKSYLSTDRQTILFSRSAPYHFDVERFEVHARRGLESPLPLDPERQSDLEAALALYQGDFLEGSYEDWCLAERERLQLLLLQVLKQLQQHCRLQGAFDRAIDYGQRLLRLDPLQEDVHRELMRCYQQAGQRSQALAQFQRCRQILQRELWIEPMLQTRRLYRSIRDAGEHSPLEELPDDSYAALQVAMGQFRRALDAMDLAWQALQAIAEELGEPEPLPGGATPPERSG